MSKPRSATADYAMYLVVRVILCVVQMLTLPASRRLADLLAWLAYHVDRRHRLVADDNLRLAFADQYDARDRDRVVRGVYRHFCLMVVEIAHLPRKLRVETWRRYLTLENGSAVIDGLLAGRPLLLVTGHFGNWEMGGYLLGLLGFSTYAIARKLDNPYLNEFLLHRFRQRTGQHILYKDGDFERIQAVLAAGGAIATLGDQDAGARGQFVDFFGRPASTHKAIALLALEYNATMVVIGSPRNGSWRPGSAFRVARCGRHCEAWSTSGSFRRGSEAAAMSRIIARTTLPVASRSGSSCSPSAR